MEPSGGGMLDVDRLRSEFTTEEEFEKKYVHEVYEEIAEHFSGTRYKAWPRIEQHINSMEAGALWADVGSGNGKYLKVNRCSTLGIGSDMSAGLIGVSRSRGHEVMVADGLHLPFRDAVFDHVICIAVIHHMSSEKRRIRAIEELKRICRVGGTILIYVWAEEQDKFRGKTKENGDLFVPWHLQKRFQKNAPGETPAEEQVYQRYYHLYRQGELDSLVTKVAGLNIRETGFDSDNWFVVAERRE